ncbi:hypothetical protein PENTCL1PPCAC_27814 [Pristionchus entomophagus]|uniref:Piwi domain-containing protein n=1 Tax=Pristionchus entomophagus TaxID=358040 RepID=A0AAV5UIC1_9BILA|nr:hypothetical protein PENTCL1PPCAC_27814 [Pristionchus entomophagus]
MAPAASAPEATAALIKKPRGVTGQPLKFKTNVYPLTIQKKIPYFKHDIRVKVDIKTPEGKDYTRELTNSSRFYDDDCRKGANVNVLHALAKKAPLLKKSLIYDRAAILFTLEEIIMKGEQEELTFTLPRTSLGANDIFDSVKEVHVTIKKATDRYQITSDDYASAAGADFVEGGDKSIFELLNIATSQCVVDHTDECAADSRSRIYILNPGDYSGLQEERDIGDGQILRTSLKKTVKTIENVLKDGKIVNPIPAIVIDVTRTAMHKAELMSAKLNYKSHPSQLMGLRVKKTYGNKELLTVSGFTEKVANCTVTIGEQKMKLAEYIKKQYNITLRETNLPGVRDRKGNTFPPELLMIIEQGVKPEQNTPNTSRNVILANATPGEERMATISSLTEALHLDGDRAKQMGVMLQKNTAALKVAGRMLPSKKLVFGKGQTSMGFQRGSRPVFYPALVNKWAFLSVANRDDYEWVIDTLQKKGRDHGMTVDKPLFKATRLTLNEVREAIGKAAAAGCTYAFIVSDFDGDHDIIKAAEREHGIMTQQMRGKNTEKIGADTGSNVCLKMNVKNGGLNHVVGDEPLLLREDLLIMSLVFDHPSSISKKEMDDGVRPTCPAVIGISCNAAVIKEADKIIPQSCQNFAEKFAYANPREWKKEGEPTFRDTVFELIRHEVEAFKVARGKPARQIIVYVSGVAEAERGYWSKEGRSLVADVCHTFSQAYNPFTTIITMSTEGAERFVAEGKPANVRGPDPRIGLVIDQVVVNPKVNEFFLQSAKALKGTPRTIKYTLVAEPANPASQRTMDELQNLTWALSHLHQYCFGTIGFPSPSRIAADAAKRARDLFKHRQSQSRSRGPYDLEELNKTLGFKSEKASSTTRSV